MESSPELTESERARDALKGFWFLVILLLIATVTGSMVLYKIKQADKNRKATLRSTYTALGGDPSKPRFIDPEFSAAPGDVKSLFTSVYEFNQYVRAFGLGECLQRISPRALSSLLESLKLIGSNEAAYLVQQSWDLMHSEKIPASERMTTPIDQPENPQARKFAKAYNVSTTKGVDAALFRYYLKHTAELQNPGGR